MLQYLEAGFVQDTPISAQHIQSLFSAEPPGKVDWAACSEELGFPLLHLVSLNEATEPAELFWAVTTLLELGAPPDLEDSDGDMVLEAVITCTEQTEEDGGEDPEKTAEHQELNKQRHLAVVRALLRFQFFFVSADDVTRICGWLRRFMPPRAQEQVLQDLRERVGDEQVTKAWSSQSLLEYLEQKVYVERVGIEARCVAEFLKRGAQPGHQQHGGATALLMVVLNPFCSLEELREVFRTMLAVDPMVAGARDAFQLTALQWAADYANVSQQHQLPRPNPAAMLALLPLLLTLPPEVDGGELCWKVAADGFCSSVPPATAPRPEPPRFLEGDRVICRTEAPGGEKVWEEGVVVGLWYREGCWPAVHPGAPYEVLLDIGKRVFALADDDRIVRREADGAPPAEAQPVGGAAAPAARTGSRFARRQREDGAWEMLDTSSGKARPCSPPDSDDEGS